MYSNLRSQHVFILLVSHCPRVWRTRKSNLSSNIGINTMFIAKICTLASRLGAAWASMNVAPVSEAKVQIFAINMVSTLLFQGKLNEASRTVRRHVVLALGGILPPGGHAVRKRPQSLHSTLEWVAVWGWTIPLKSHFASKKPPSLHTECSAMGRLQLSVSLLSLFSILTAGKWLSQRAIRQSGLYSASVISRLSANMLSARMTVSVIFFFPLLCQKCREKMQVSV